jgi:ABC-2 type transport system ATP-binding protein
VSNVEKWFGNRQVLKNINVAFEEGKIHGLIGRNGSGKTVLIKCICGFITADKGIVEVFSRRIGKDMDFPANTGIVIETPGFLPQYSGYKNLKFLNSLQMKETRADIQTILQEVGLEPSDKKHVGKYSLGMKQRLALAQALMGNPSLLVLDEPMNGLDNQGVLQMRKLFKQLRDKGKTIVITSHNKDDIDELCDTVHAMDDGMIIARERMTARATA